MPDSNKLQELTYTLLTKGLTTLSNDESKLKWIKEALNYLKMFPPQEKHIHAEELSGLLAQYDRNPSLNKRN